MQPLLADAFTDKHVLIEMIGPTMEELCFLRGRCREVMSEAKFRA
jgi:hypothetical protein